MAARVLIVLWVLVVIVGSPHAQAQAPSIQDPSVDGRVTGVGGTKIPVTMPQETETLDAERSGTSAAAASVSMEQPLDPDTYICGPGDVFELDFWGQQNFRLKIAIDLEGRTFVSKVGFVAVAGKTLSAVRKVIKERVRANYPGLKFELTLSSPRTFLVHLVDNVRQPGIYTATPLERLSVVLARAGGITGSKRRISIRRRDGSSVSADLVQYELTGETKYNPYLVDGDVVTVPFADVTVAVTGAVRRPGAYELIGSRDLTELLALAGGFTTGVARSRTIRVVRHNDKQQEVVEDVAFSSGGSPNAALRDTDQITVPGTGDLQRTVMLIGAVVGAESIDAAATSKRLPFVEGDTVLSLINRAGGVTAPGDLRRSYITRQSSGHPPTVIPLDLEALLVRRDFRADVKIEIGDTIVIPPFQYSISVEGAVAKPGLYPYNPMFGVTEYLARAGGRTRTAKDVDDIRLIDPNGTTRSFQANLKLKPGDAILVPERNWTRSEIVQLVMGGAGLILSGVALGYAITR